MPEWTRYRSLVTLADIVVPTLAANVEEISPVSGQVTTGAGSVLQVGPAVPNNLVPNGYEWDGYALEITSPVAADGSHPDVRIKLVVDGTDLSDFFVIDGTYENNIFPQINKVYAHKVVRLGVSTRQLILEYARKNPKEKEKVLDIPLKATGLKITQSFQIKVYSRAGWTNAAVPLRVVLRGDYLADENVAQLMALGFPPNFAYQALGFDPVRGVFIPAATTDPRTWWKSLPGGTAQGIVKIFRFIKYARNNIAIPNNRLIPFTTQNGLGGDPSYLEDSLFDLGDQFRGKEDVFIWQEFGVNLIGAGLQAYVAFLVDNTVVPKSNQFGEFISSGNNRLAFGAADASYYLPAPRVEELAHVVSYHANVVPAVASAGSASLPVGSVEILKGGVLVRRAAA